VRVSLADEASCWLVGTSSFGSASLDIDRCHRRPALANRNFFLLIFSLSSLMTLSLESFPDGLHSLAHNNTTGFCHEHGGRAPKKTDAVVRKTNGAAHHPERRNGAQHVAVTRVSKPDGRALAIAERVELVLRTIPLAEKSRMVAAWLTGD
jgi:hypothetical protein